jgi:hypothetical protein
MRKVEMQNREYQKRYEKKQVNTFRTIDELMKEKVNHNQIYHGEDVLVKDEYQRKGPLYK